MPHFGRRRLVVFGANVTVAVSDDDQMCAFHQPDHTATLDAATHPLRRRVPLLGAGPDTPFETSDRA